MVQVVLRNPVSSGEKGRVTTFKLCPQLFSPQNPVLLADQKVGQERERRKQSSLPDALSLVSLAGFGRMPWTAAALRLQMAKDQVELLLPLLADPADRRIR